MSDNKERIEDLKDQMGEINPEALIIDDMDEAIIGIGRIAYRYKFIYSMRKMLEILMETRELDLIEALDYYEFNIGGAYMGKQTPMILEIGVEGIDTDDPSIYCGL